MSDSRRIEEYATGIFLAGKTISVDLTHGFEKRYGKPATIEGTNAVIKSSELRLLRPITKRNGERYENQINART